MTIVKIEPTKDVPIPYDTSDETAPTLIEAMAVAGNTAELQLELGAPLELDDSRAAKAVQKLEEVIKTHRRAPLSNQSVALTAAAFLREYASALALDVAAARSAITYKLMEIANCGDPKHELRALELLGKHSDIGLFTERSEITITHKDPNSLEEAIKDRVKRILNAEVIDMMPIHTELEDELGVPKQEMEVYVPRTPDYELEEELGAVLPLKPVEREEE